MEKHIRSLGVWFVIHFVVDMLFALPLMIAPRAVMELFGFVSVNGLTARLVAAALLGIGGVSLIERGATVPVFRALLSLKLIWSSTAVLAIALSILEGGPWSLWLFLGIFVVFFGIWLRYRLTLGSG